MQFEKIKLKCCKAQFFPRFPKEDDSGFGKKMQSCVAIKKKT